jgi:hypothetical protein
MPLNWPACERRVPPDERDTELAMRNSLNLARWYTDARTFGPVVGRQLFREHLRRIL